MNMEIIKKTTGIAVLILDKINLKTKATTKDKEGPSSSISGYLATETPLKKLIQKNICIHMFIAGLFSIAKI